MSIKRNGKQIAGNYVNINYPLLTEEFNNMYKQLTQVVSSFGTSVGSEKVWRGETAPENYIFLEGQLISRSAYSQLYNWAVSNKLIVSDDEWNTNKKYGLYSYGDGSTTFRVPKMTGYYLVGYDPTVHKTLGVYQDSMLPDISGNLDLRGTNGSYFTKDSNADGIFEITTKKTEGYPITGSTTLVEGVVENVSFDISKQVNVGDRVQPPSIPVKYVVCYRDFWANA